MTKEVSHKLSEFRDRCQELYICFAASAFGVREQAEGIAKTSPDLSKRIFFGSGPPSDENFVGVMNVQQYLKSSVKDGHFASTIAASIITTMYSVWDETYRHLIAEEMGVPAKDIRSPLMGDLRWVRHCVIHHKSVVNKKAAALKELDWQLQEGSELVITGAMFQRLIRQINVMSVEA